MQLERGLSTENLWKALFCLVVYIRNKICTIMLIYLVKDWPIDCQVLLYQNLQKILWFRLIWDIWDMPHL